MDYSWPEIPAGLFPSLLPRDPFRGERPPPCAKAPERKRSSQSKAERNASPVLRAEDAMPASWRQNRTGAFSTRGVRVEHGTFIGRLRSAPQPKHRFIRNGLLDRLCGASLLVKVGSFPARVHGGDGALTGILPRAVDPPEGGSFRTSADKTEAALEKTASDPLPLLTPKRTGAWGADPSWGNGAGGGNRTLMGQAPRDFESRASTSFTTPAFGGHCFRPDSSACQDERGRDFSLDASAPAWSHYAPNLIGSSMGLWRSWERA